MWSLHPDPASIHSAHKHMAMSIAHHGLTAKIIHREEVSAADPVPCTDF